MNASRRPYPIMHRHANICGVIIPCGCISFFSVLGFGFILMGMIMTVVGQNDPFEDNPFFKNRPDPIKIIGPIILSIGLLLLCFSIILCIIAVTTNPAPVIHGQQQNLQTGESGVLNYYPPVPTASAPAPSAFRNLPPETSSPEYDEKIFDPPPPYSSCSRDEKSQPQHEELIQPSYNPACL